VSGNKDYEDRTSHKLKVYEKNQIPVIAMYSMELNRNWRASLLGIISNKLKRHFDDLNEKLRSQYM